MKYKTIITENEEPIVVIYTPKRTNGIIELESYIDNLSEIICGYKDNLIENIPLNEIYCFCINDGKLYVYTKNDKLFVKYKLYEIEELIDESFVKINQSCIVRVSAIASFNASFKGTLVVKLKNGFTDYVSRRQMKKVKERISLK